MTLANMVSNILALAPGLHPEFVKSTIQSSYRQLCMMDWNVLRISQNIYTVPPYSIGTVSVNANGEVTGSDTSWTSDMVGRQMRLYYSDSLFTIASVIDSTHLTLSDWTGEVFSNLPYSIYKLIYACPSNFKLLYDVVYQTSLPKKSQHYFNELDPARHSSGTPMWWAFAGYNSSYNLLIEIYPKPDGTYPLRLYGKRKESILSDSDSPILPEDLIEAHALLTCLRFKANQQPGQGWEQRLAEQQLIYNDILERCLDEDYERGASRTKVKDTMGEPDYPIDNNFWVSHAIE